MIWNHKANQTNSCEQPNRKEENRTKSEQLCKEGRGRRTLQAAVGVPGWRWFGSNHWRCFNRRGWLWRDNRGLHWFPRVEWDWRRWLNIWVTINTCQSGYFASTCTYKHQCICHSPVKTRLDANKDVIKMTGFRCL